MNDSKFLIDFYGPTVLWFGPTFAFMGLLAVLGNGLLIWIALSTPSIRSVGSHWLVIGMSFSDFLFSFNSFVLTGITFICGRDGSCPVLVKICGGFTVSAISSGIVFPTLILMNRYLSVTTLPNVNSKLRIFLNSKKGILCIIAFTWFIALTNWIILASFDALGEDFIGVCGAKPFTSFGLYLIYMATGAYGISSYFVTYYFYSKLQKFVKQRMERGREILSIRQQQRKENNDTKEVMKMVKLSTLIPLATLSVGFTLDGGQWFIPHDLVPMWFRRVASIIFAVNPICGPFIAMFTLGPFKRQLNQRFGCFRGSIFTSSRIDTAVVTTNAVSVPAV